MVGKWAIAAAYLAVFGTPALGVVAIKHRYATGAWPTPDRATLWLLAQAPVLGIEAWWRRYRAHWRDDIETGDAWQRPIAACLGASLLFRVGIHSLVAAAIDGDRGDIEVRHDLCWVPVPALNIGPRLVARVWTAGIGLTLGWMVWGVIASGRWPAWMPWWGSPAAEAFLLAQGTVWAAEPIAAIRDVIQNAT